MAMNPLSYEQTERQQERQRQWQRERQIGSIEYIVMLQNRPHPIPKRQGERHIQVNGDLPLDARCG